jgi:hypothetical protein
MLRVILIILLLAGAATAQIDWQYIESSNERALEAFLDDHLTAEKFQAPENRGCCRSWRGIYNCTNYGLPLWVWHQSKRSSLALQAKANKWLALHVHHLVNYGYNWTKHLPGGEGVMSHPVWLQTRSDDSDRLRHVHLAPYCVIYADRSISLPEETRARLKEMILDWADNYYLQVRWDNMRKHGQLFQYGRSMVPALGLIYTYYLTRDYKYLMAAQYIFASTYLGFERRVGSFYAYDSGYAAEGRTKKLLYYSAHLNMEPWQIAFTGEVAAHLYVLTYDPNVKKLCRKVILRITDWVTRPDIPYGDLEREGDGRLRLSFLQGGSQESVYGRQMDPLAAMKIGQETTFIPLFPLRAHYWDGGYYKWSLPTGERRVHYPRRPIGYPPPGPTGSHPLLYNWADMLLARYFLTGQKRDLAWAQWSFRDDKYFANRSSVVDWRKLSKRDKVWYGGGNTSVNRSFAWLVRGSLWARTVLPWLK